MENHILLTEKKINKYQESVLRNIGNSKGILCLTLYVGNITFTLNSNILFEIFYLYLIQIDWLLMVGGCYTIFERGLRNYF